MENKILSAEDILCKHETMKFDIKEYPNGYPWIIKAMEEYASQFTAKGAVSDEEIEKMAEKAAHRVYTECVYNVILFDPVKAKRIISNIFKAALSNQGARWVKVEDDMPDYDVPVLWIDADGHYFVQDLDKDGNPWLDEQEAEEVKFGRVTHWQPLPAPPNKSDIK